MKPLRLLCAFFALFAAACSGPDAGTHPIELAMLAREGKLPYKSETGEEHGPAANTSGLSPAELEKQKALASPYPNDLGPETLDVSSYPQHIQDGYETFLTKCTVCHSAARPLNSQFLESKGESGDQRKAAMIRLKTTDPDIFAGENRLIWQVEPDIWQRFVKRMRAKPGCDITQSEVQLIWKFLSYDSLARKSGSNKANWAAHRRKLVSDFKKKHPARYNELFSE